MFYIDKKNFNDDTSFNYLRAFLFILGRVARTQEIKNSGYRTNRTNEKYEGFHVQIMIILVKRAWVMS